MAGARGPPAAREQGLGLLGTGEGGDADRDRDRQDEVSPGEAPAAHLGADARGDRQRLVGRDPPEQHSEAAALDPPDRVDAARCPRDRLARDAQGGLAGRGAEPLDDRAMRREIAEDHRAGLAGAPRRLQPAGEPARQPLTVAEPGQRVGLLAGRRTHRLAPPWLWNTWRGPRSLATGGGAVDGRSERLEQHGAPFGLPPRLHPGTRDRSPSYDPGVVAPRRSDGPFG